MKGKADRVKALFFLSHSGRFDQYRTGCARERLLIKMRCVCCGKFSAHNYVRLFGETAIKENIKEAIEKYGGITVSVDVVAKSSACV